MAGKTSPAVHFIQHFSNFRVRSSIKPDPKGDAAEGTLLSSGVIFTPLTDGRLLFTWIVCSVPLLLLCSPMMAPR
jgi:hypothetical protein